MEKQIDLAGDAFQFLIDIGRLRPPSGQSKGNPIPLTERNRAADVLGQAAKKPVSEMIIEDRGEW